MAIRRTFTSTAALFLCASVAWAQAPANDDCASPTPATLGLNSFDTTAALDPGFDQAGATCGFTTEVTADVWFSFTPGSSGSYDFATLDNGAGVFDTKFTVFSNGVPACPPLVSSIAGCDDDSGPGLQSALTVSLISGTQYLIQVGGFAGASGAMDLSITTTPPPPPVPANDNCGSAVATTLGLVGFNSTSATDGAGLALDPIVCDMGPFGDEQIYADVWYRFTPAMSGFFDIASVNNGGLSFDSRLAVYNQSSCPDVPANVIACDDDSGPFNEALASSVPLTGGQTYLIRVGSYAPGTPVEPAALSIAMGVAPPAAPPNDNCATASVALLGLTSFDSRNATDGSGLALNPLVCDMGSFGDEQIYADVWFLHTPTTTGFFDVASVNNGNPFFDSRIAVYNQSTCPDNPSTVIGCDDDSGPVLEALAASVPMTSGQTYLIRVGSYDAAVTAELAALSISVGVAPPAPPANDNCANATVISTFGLYPYNTSFATTDGADLAGFCDIGSFGDDIVHNDVWFAYTPAVGGCTYISTLGLAGGDTRIAVYGTASCPDDPTRVIGCSDEEVQPISAPFEAGLDIDLVAGTDYLIRVGTYDALTPGIVSSLLISAGPVAAGNLGVGEMQTGSSGCAPGPTFTELCFGDGGNQMGCTNCPCTNNAAIGSGGGCANSSGLGTRLIPSGDPSVSLPTGSSADLRFGADGAPPTAFCILNAGDGVAPGNMANPCFGLNTGGLAAVFDGLRCAIMNTRRHGGRSADANGEVGVTNNPWGGSGGPPVGLANAGSGYVAGQTRYFQIINRDDALLVCMRGLNTSQAVEVTFTP